MGRSSKRSDFNGRALGKYRRARRLTHEAQQLERTDAENEMLRLSPSLNEIGLTVESKTSRGSGVRHPTLAIRFKQYGWLVGEWWPATGTLMIGGVRKPGVATLAEAGDAVAYALNLPPRPLQGIEPPLNPDPGPQW
jgi:hypothetical protein